MGKYRVEENLAHKTTWLSHSVVLFDRVEGGRCLKSLREKRMGLNLIIIRLRNKYLCNLHEEMCLRIFWINVVLKFG
jgi:hypothetical protein